MAADSNIRIRNAERGPLLALLLAASACFFAGDRTVHAEEPAGVQSGRLKADRILFLGNSITLHAPAPYIGWTSNFGMAASAEEKDYVHVLAGAIAKLSGSQPEMQVDNIYEFEKDYDTYDLAKLQKHLDFKPDIVVVAIGENVPALSSEDSKNKFNDSFGRLLAALKNNGQPAIYVRSCFWADKTKDAIMQKACAEAGCVFVDISKLGDDESNYARSERSFTEAGVAAHPGDKGMKAIADALLTAITSELGKQR
jgi:hypothetical protein